jgi:hypothetical protein
VSTTNASPIKNAFQELKWVTIMGMGQESGLTDVPDAAFIRSMLAAFMSTMFMPGMELWASAGMVAAMSGMINIVRDRRLL